MTKLSRRRSDVKRPHLQSVYEARKWGPLELSNRLRVLELPMAPDQIAGFCGPRFAPQAPGSKGCAKFQRCDLHPQDLKDVPIEKIKREDPQAYAYLRKNGCLRVLFTKREWRERFAQEQLTLGDHIGAVDENGRSLLPRTCPYFGCVVPELARLESESESEAMFQGTCPFAHVRDARDRAVRPNMYRYVACKISRRSFRDFQQALRVVAISPIAILPGTSIQPDLFYFGKHWAAPYQYPAWNPEATGHVLPELPQPLRLPQEEARLHAPRLVRHSIRTSDEPALDQVGANQTIRSLSLLNEPTKLSRFENSVGVRYIPAGEFLYLCLMWYWSGERYETRGASRNLLGGLLDKHHPRNGFSQEWETACQQLQRDRDVWLESAETDLSADVACLLQELNNIGFADELRNVFGLQMGADGRQQCGDDVLRAEQGGRRFVRRSCRLEDFVHLGLLDVENGLSFTARGQELTKWLCEATRVISDGVSDSDLSPFHAKRCRALLRADRNTSDRLKLMKPITRRLNNALQYGQISEWLMAINQFLNHFGVGRSRNTFRSYLREHGFPVYPLVHLTLLSGLKMPLDWYAIPFGGTVRLPSYGRPKASSRFRPHGAFLVLAAARDPSDARDLVTQLQPVLLPTLIPQIGQWAEELVTRSTQVAEFSTFVAARKHDFANMLGFFEEYSKPSGRTALIRERLEDEQELDELSGLIGKVLSAARQAEKDGDELGRLVATGFSWFGEDTDLEDVFYDIESVIAPLSEMCHRRLDTSQLLGPADRSIRVRVPKHLAFHLLLQLVQNVVKHDVIETSSQRDPILVQSEARDVRVLVLIWNTDTEVGRSHIELLDRYNREYVLENIGDVFLQPAGLFPFPKGLKVVRILALLAGCDVSFRNARHPVSCRLVGVTEVDFPLVAPPSEKAAGTDTKRT